MGDSQSIRIRQSEPCTMGFHTGEPYDSGNLTSWNLPGVFVQDRLEEKGRTESGEKEGTSLNIFGLQEKGF